MSVADIVDDIRREKDAALRRWSLELDGTVPARARPEGEIPERALLELAANVRAWHEAQLPRDIELEVRPGVHLARRWSPLGSVGIYVPRKLISTLVMCGVPAQVAGVSHVVVVTPPRGAELVAAAAALLGIDEVWALGGPPAIAALAYGTESIAPVDKIVGPGNAFVNEAKLLVARDVAIDLPAGPSEVVVVAGPDVDQDSIDAEIAAQAEHGPDTVTKVLRVADNEDHVLEEVARLAPEHVLLLGHDVEPLAKRIRNAGAVFIGRCSSVAFGDYATGGNHVLPTGGWARSVGGLSVETFMKSITFQRVDPVGAVALKAIAEPLADAEGMRCHAAAVRKAAARGAATLRTTAPAAVE